MASIYTYGPLSAQDPHRRATFILHALTRGLGQLLEAELDLLSTYPDPLGPIGRAELRRRILLEGGP